MRRVQAREAGGSEVLEVVEVPTPTAGPGQILVRHEAIGLNFIDIYQRSGLYPMTYPAPMGNEAAGVVAAIGEGVTRFKAGDRVAYTGGQGAYADFNVVMAEKAVHIPDGVATDVAAASLLKGMTAEFLLHRTFHVKHGQVILVHAAAGGVGSILTQWAKAIGATVIGAVGSEAKAEVAKTQGCDHVILYDQDDVPAKVKEITGGKGVPVVYDSVGKATFDASLNSLARRGMLVTFGNASGPAPAIEPLRLSRGGSLFLTRPTLFDYIATTEELDASAAAIFAAIKAGDVKVDIGQRFPLADARKAHDALANRQTTGSSILVP
jgi:NADPH2:quinone reductase